MRRRRPHLFAALALVSALGAAVNVGAQTAAPVSAPSPEVVKQADAHFRKGNLAYTDKKWAEAETAFLAAWALNPTYDVAANLGQTQYHLGRYRDAAEHLDFALRHWPLIGKPEPRKLAEDRLAELRTMVAMLKIDIKAEHADLYVDGKLVGQSPMKGEVFVEAGVHKIEAKHELYGAETLAVSATMGATETVRFALGEVVASASAVPSGGPVVPPPDKRRTPVIVTGSVLAGGGLIAGAVLAAVSEGKASTAGVLMNQIEQKSGKNACGAGPVPAQCAALHAAREPQYAFGNAALWTFVGAGTVGVATMVYALIAPRRAQTTGLRVVPAVAPQGAAAVVSGTW